MLAQPYVFLGAASQVAPPAPRYRLRRSQDFWRSDFGSRLTTKGGARCERLERRFRNDPQARRFHAAFMKYGALTGGHLKQQSRRRYATSGFALSPHTCPSRHRAGCRTAEVSTPVRPLKHSERPRDEARRIAVDFTKLPDLLRKPQT